MNELQVDFPDSPIFQDLSGHPGPLDFPGPSGPPRPFGPPGLSYLLDFLDRPDFLNLLNLLELPDQKIAASL